MPASFLGASQLIRQGVARTLVQRLSALAGERANWLHSDGGVHSPYDKRLATRGQRLHRYSKNLRCTLDHSRSRLLCGVVCVALATVRLTLFAPDAMRPMYSLGSKAAIPVQYTAILSCMTGPFPSETLMKRSEFHVIVVLKNYTYAA